MNKFKNIFTYILSILASVVGIVLNFVLAKMLQAETYGRLQYYVALSTTFSQFMIIGLNTFLIKEAKNTKQNFDVFSKCASLYFVVLLFEIPIVTFILKSNSSISVFFRLYIIITSAIMGLSSLISATYQGRGKYRVSIVFENLIPKAILLILALTFYSIGRIGLLTENYLLFYIIIYLAISIPLFVINYKCFKLSFNSSEICSIFFFFGITVTYSLGNNLTKVLQGSLYKNDVALAIISISISIISLVRVFTSVFDNIIKPLFAKLKRESDEKELIDLYRFDTRINAYISIPLYLFFIIHNSRFLGIFGESYTVFPLILTIISISNAISDLTGPNGTMLAMTGKEKWELFNGCLYFAVYILFVFVFSFDKIYGLCWALLVAQTVVNVAKYLEVWFIFKCPPLNVKTIISLLIIIIINFSAIYPLSFVKNTFVWFALGIAVGICLIAANIFILSLYRKSDFRRLLILRL